MKIYIAAKYGRRLTGLREARDRLVREGHECTAQWIDGGEEAKPIVDAAIMDVEDVDRAKVLIFVGEPQASENRGGGRWWEFGYAFAKGKICIALLDMDPTRGGHDHLPLGHESVFTALPGVTIAKSWDEISDLLRIFDRYGMESRDA